MDSCKQKLQVKLHSITGVEPPDSFLSCAAGTRDLFCDFYFEHDSNLSEPVQSRKILDSCNPEWKPPQSFKWGVNTTETGIGGMFIVVEVFDWDRFFEQDKPIGFAHIPLAECRTDTNAKF